MKKNTLGATQARKAPLIRSTTVLTVRKGDKVVMAADGQVTLGDHVIKHNARKVRRMYNEKILSGFAGSTADAFSLFSREIVSTTIDESMIEPSTIASGERRSTPIFTS